MIYSAVFSMLRVFSLFNAADSNFVIKKKLTHSLNYKIFSEKIRSAIENCIVRPILAKAKHADTDMLFSRPQSYFFVKLKKAKTEIIQKFLVLTHMAKTKMITF